MVMLKHEIHWSASRINELEYCERKYYFSHYEAWNGWDDDETERKKKAYMLKNRTNIKAWIGTATHRAIKEYLEFRLPAERIKIGISISMKSEFEMSRCKQYLNGFRKGFGLIEHYRDQNIGPHDLEESISSAMDNFDVFLASIYHDMILRARKDNRMMFVDPGMNFDLMKFYIDGICVYAIPDIWVNIQEHKYLILDWKTGKEGDTPVDEPNLQLLVYGLRLSVDEKLEMRNDHIQAYEVYLPSLKRVGGTVTSDHLQRVIERIKSDIRTMQSYCLDISQNIPKEENAFKATTSENKCLTCNYSEICKKI
jgi:hypothetical protein